MKSFNVNLQNKRLSISGIFAGAETNKQTECTTAYKNDKNDKNAVSATNTTHTTLTWLTNKHTVLSDKYQNKLESKQAAQAQTVDIEQLCLAMRQDSAEPTSYRQNVSCFYLAMLTLHIVAFTLFILLLVINKQEKLFFGSLMHLTIVSFVPMHVAFATSRKRPATFAAENQFCHSGELKNLEL